MSSRIGTTFWPNPPPVSRMMTRTPCAGMPSSRAANARSSCGVCVDAHTVSSSDDACPLDDHAARLDRHRRIDLLVDVRFRDVGGGRERLLVRRRASHSACDVVGIRRMDDHIGFGGQPNSLSEVATAGSGS